FPVTHLARPTYFADTYDTPSSVTTTKRISLTLVLLFSPPRVIDSSMSRDVLPAFVAPCASSPSAAPTPRWCHEREHSSRQAVQRSDYLTMILKPWAPTLTLVLSRPQTSLGGSNRGYI